MSSLAGTRLSLSSKHVMLCSTAYQVESNETKFKMSPKSQKCVNSHHTCISEAWPQITLADKKQMEIESVHRNNLEVTSGSCKCSPKHTICLIDTLEHFTTGCPGSLVESCKYGHTNTKIGSDFRDENTSSNNFDEAVQGEGNREEMKGDVSKAYIGKSFTPTSDDLQRSANTNNNQDKSNRTSGTYISLIAKAILSSPHRRLVLQDIYLFVSVHFPEIANRGNGWRNSIRHNLSLNNCFVKVGRSPCGKGHYWGISSSSLPEFLKGNFRRKRSTKFSWRKPLLKCPEFHTVHPTYERMSTTHGGSYHSYFSTESAHRYGLPLFQNNKERNQVTKMPSTLITDCHYCQSGCRLRSLKPDVCYPHCCSSNNNYCMTLRQAFPNTSLHMVTFDTKIGSPCHEWYMPFTQIPFPYPSNFPTQFCNSFNYAGKRIPCFNRCSGSELLEVQPL